MLSLQAGILKEICLSKHLVGHSESKFTCKECGKQFSRLDSLRRHNSVHQKKSSKFECKLCHTNFTAKTNLPWCTSVLPWGGRPPLKQFVLPRGGQMAKGGPLDNFSFLQDRKVIQWSPLWYFEKLLGVLP